MQTTITCRIRAIGALWVPGCNAVWSQDYSVGDGPFQRPIRTLADAEYRLTVDSGDLSRIDDYEVAFSIARTYPNPQGVGHVVHSREWIARPWRRPESEYEYMDAAYPSEDEDAA